MRPTPPGIVQSISAWAWLRKRRFCAEEDDDADELVEAEDPEGLLKIVLEGGNFGHFAASRRESLSGPAASRKGDTLKRILRKAPFGLRYAPGKYLWYIFTLVKGNLRAPSPPSSF